MDITVIPQVDAAAECILLLNRYHSQLPEIPNSIQESTNQLCEKYDIPHNILTPGIEPLIQIENHVLQGLTAPVEQIRFFFSYAEATFANLAWALYFLEQEGINFEEISNAAMLQELRRLLCITLNCPAKATENIVTIQDLAAFLDAFPCAVQTKWACLMFWCHPAAYQKQFRSILQEAVSRFHEMDTTVQTVLEEHMDAFQALARTPGSSMPIQKLASDLGENIVLYPSLMWFSGIGVVWDHTHPHTGKPLLLAGILYPLLTQLTEKYSNNSEFLANGSKSLANVHRINILKALKVKPMCNQDLTELLGLSAATISQHMSCLVQDGFVNISKRGNWVDYSLNSENLGLFLSNIYSTLLQ